MPKPSTLFVAALLLTLTTTTPAWSDPPVRTQMVDEAGRMTAMIRTPAARAFLETAKALPPMTPRTIHPKATDRTVVLSAAEFARLSPADAKAYETKTLDEAFFYTTRYGTPVAYARPLDLVSAARKAPLTDARFIDFGFGTIGHLKMLALAGVHVTGIDVDPRLRALYSTPEDVGPLGKGHVELLFGRFPALDARFPAGKADVFTAKNTLKRGYIHPERPTKPGQTIDLGCTDAQFVASVARTLKPGGLFLIYNLTPPQAAADAPYIPWADGRSPFDRATFAAAGFEVLAFDADDTAPARAMARHLGWGAAGQTYHATYTLARKR